MRAALSLIEICKNNVSHKKVSHKIIQLVLPTLFSNKMDIFIYIYMTLINNPLTLNYH